MDAMRKTCLYLAPAEDDPLRLRVSEMVAAALAPLGCDVVPEGSFTALDRLADSANLCVIDVTQDTPLKWYVCGRRRALRRPCILLCEERARMQLLPLMFARLLTYTADPIALVDMQQDLADLAEFYLTPRESEGDTPHSALFDQIDRVLGERLACLVSLDDDIRTQLDTWRAQTVSQLHEAARLADPDPPSGQTLQQWFDRRMDEAVEQMRAERVRSLDDGYLQELFDRYLDKALDRMRGTTADPTVRAGESLQEWFDKRLDQVVSQLADVLEGRDPGECDRK